MIDLCENGCIKSPFFLVLNSKGKSSASTFTTAFMSLLFGVGSLALYIEVSIGYSNLFLKFWHIKFVILYSAD